MAYTAANVVLLIQAPGAGPRFWYYTEAATGATVDASAYFSDGYARGMRDGDLLFHYNSTSKIYTTHTVTVSGTTVDLADGTQIGTTTNTD